MQGISTPISGKDFLDRSKVMKINTYFTINTRCHEIKKTIGIDYLYPFPDHKMFLTGQKSKNSQNNLESICNCHKRLDLSIAENPDR